MSVIVSRALPDVRDGLKPSQRRILVAMNDLGLGPSSATSKCAAIVGETMKRYHPHGDASIYDSLVRMAQDWVLRYKLVHGQGNFGSIAGLPAAAHRYTEARLTPVAGELLHDLERETVDFIDNYDGKYREPLVLPSKFPNLLVNGSDGIAVGMATEIPPHNLREVCTSLLRLIDNPEASMLELMANRGEDDCGVRGPDFPTGGTIMGQQGILDGYSTGRGKITLRARCEVVEGKKAQIIIREVPFQQTRNRLAAEIGSLVKEERVKGIDEVRDESAPRLGEPVRIVVYLKKDVDPHLILNQIYQFSSLQKTVSIILLALVEGRPKVLTIKEMMQEFIKHRVQVIRRRTEYLLREAKRRGHVLEGQLIAISSIEEVIRICRNSPNRAEAKLQLQDMKVAAGVLNRAIGDEAFAALSRELGVAEVYQMTEQQAEAVVRLQLGQLAALERDEIYKEYAGLREQIVSYELLIGDEKNILAVVRADCVEMRSKYGDARKTEFAEQVDALNYEDLLEEQEQVVSISHMGYIKRLALNTYRVQHRGGIGVSGGSREDDFVEHFFVASTHAFLLFFTDHGQVYWLKVYHIPEASRTSAGRSIANVLSLKPEEKISSVIPVRSFEGEFYLMMATRNGLVKKTPLVDYSRPRAGGIIGINLEDGDSLIDVCLTKPTDEVLLATRKGMALRFAESDARPMGRNTKGVKGIKLTSGDELTGMVVTDPDGFLLTVCENGYGKRTPFGPNTAGDVGEPIDEPLVEGAAEVTPAPEVEAEVEPEAEAEGEETPDRSSMRYRRQRRGGKGVRDIRTTERNGPVVGIDAVRDTDDIMLITLQGMVNRTSVAEIRLTGRNTQGVRVMNLREGDRIVSMAKVAREEVTETEVVEGAPEVGPEAAGEGASETPG
ncbi:MAG: DNA gyrase subunit A [Planctomycetes bacterium]|nr:DNA gyrase subunit A [Planctomycetota bacterium]